MNHTDLERAALLVGPHSSRESGRISDDLGPERLGWLRSEAARLEIGIAELLRRLLDKWRGV